MMQWGQHWKKVAAAIGALLLTYIPWAWPDMPGGLHLLVWPTVVLGAVYSLSGWMKERRAAGLMAFDTPQLVMFAGLAIALLGAGWQVYRFLASTPSPGAAMLAGEEVGVVLDPPEGRHQILWNPKKDPEIRIGVEGKMIDDRWAVPVFGLRATNAVGIQDATVEWRSDINGVAELVKTAPRLTENGVTVVKEKVQIPPVGDKLGWTYDFKKEVSDRIPFITPNPPGSPLALFVDVFTNAMLYTVAKLPDGLGAELTPIPFTLTVSWTYPKPGRQQFSVIGTVKNMQAADVKEPLVDGVMIFAVKGLK